MRNCKQFVHAFGLQCVFVVVVVLVVAGRSNIISNQVKILILSVFPRDPNT